jgi:hypothetical protein
MNIRVNSQGVFETALSPIGLPQAMEWADRLLLEMARSWLISLLIQPLGKTTWLSNIDPSVDPPHYRLEFHAVYTKGVLVQDVHVIEIVVPRVLTRPSCKAFVKTDAGKKKLSGTEINDWRGAGLGYDMQSNGIVRDISTGQTSGPHLATTHE